jgi:TonB family protein
VRYKDADQVRKYKLDIENDKYLYTMADSIESALEVKDNKVIVYTYLFKARAKNAFGAKVLGEYYVQVTPTLKVVVLSNESKDLLIGEGKFPGKDRLDYLEKNPHPSVVSKVDAYIDSLQNIWNPAPVHTPVTEVFQMVVEEEPEEEMVFTVVEQQPEYPGGYEAMMDFIRKNMRYPSSARRTGVDGTVYVQFVVSMDGSISEIKTTRGVSEDCDKEAERVVRMMPNWKPGKSNGKNVSVRHVLPIRFKVK